MSLIDFLMSGTLSSYTYNPRLGRADNGVTNRKAGKIITYTVIDAYNLIRIAVSKLMALPASGKEYSILVEV